MKTFTKLTIAGLIGLGAMSTTLLATRSNTVVEESANAVAHSENYDEYHYSGNYYDSINFSAGDGMNGNLRKALTTLIKPSTTPKYLSGLKSELQRADEDPTNSNNMVYFYTRDSKTKNGAKDWNREHVWPKSLSGNCWNDISDDSDYNDAGTDILHVRPTYSSTNSNRSNLKFGYVKGEWEKYNNIVYCKKNGQYFEPIDSVKGDCARIIMYIWTAWVNYYGANKMPYPDKVFSSYNTMLEWHLIDPPDELEANRNARAYTTQGNRNPFVDHPELGWKIYGEKCYQSLTNKAKNIYPETTSTVDSLSYSGTPTVTSYIDGSEFNTSGITITAHLADGTTQNVTSNVVWKHLNSNDRNFVVGYYGGKTVKVTGLTIQPYIRATKIYFVENKVEGYVGENIQLTLGINPSNATTPTYSFTSTHPDIATIDSNGKLSLKKAGKTEIVAIATDLNISAVCDVVVKPQPGCTGSVAAGCILITITSIMALSFLASKKIKFKK